MIPLILTTKTGNETRWTSAPVYPSLEGCPKNRTNLTKGLEKYGLVGGVESLHSLHAILELKEVSLEYRKGYDSTRTSSPGGIRPLAKSLVSITSSRGLMGLTQASWNKLTMPSLAIRR